MRGVNDGETERKEQAMLKNQKSIEKRYGQEEQEMLKDSYEQSVANKEERERKRQADMQSDNIEMEQYPNKPITQKEWIKGYKKWKKEMKERDE
jgi:hypothetical protein|tara:strand:+ start:1611 stop:1892 length:282 start_codon:yes stop_codon:yes gene_type:complete